ncbi:hypothetical protein D3C79_325920 [compost metagenome]
MQNQLLHRRVAFGQHARHFVGHFLRGLGRHHQMQSLRRLIEPAIGVVRLQRRSIDRLRGITARQYQPIIRRRLQLSGNQPGIMHAFLIQLAAFAAFRPDRQVFPHRHRENRRVFQAGETIVIERLVAAHPHIAEGAPGIALQRAGLGTVFESIFAEFQLVLGKAETGEIVINQDRHCLPQIGRRLACGQQHVVAIKRRESQAVARQIFRRHQTIRLQVVSQQREVEARKQPVGLGYAQNKGVRLLLWPVRHIDCADIAGEHLLPHYLGTAVNTETHAFLMGVPVRRLKNLLFKQRGVGAAVEGGEVDGHPRYHGAFDKATP